MPLPNTLPLLLSSQPQICSPVSLRPFLSTSSTPLFSVQFLARRILLVVDPARHLAFFLYSISIHPGQNHAKKLVNADRASLFLVDLNTAELYARIFDTGNIDDDANDEVPPQSDKEIRFEQ